MKTNSLLVAVAALLINGFAFAGPKTYQVTGPVTALTDAIITVQKGKESWEVARDGSTKVTGDLKVGSKVTIEYTMTAVTVDAKAAAAGGDKKKDKK